MEVGGNATGGRVRVESASAERAAIAAAQDELEKVVLCALVCKLAMDVCESKLPGEPDEMGCAMAKCDGKGKGIDAILRFGEVGKSSREAALVSLSGKGRVLRSISILAFP